MIEASAVLRLKDEAEWLPKCVESIQGIFSEILLCTQGKSIDETEQICKDLADGNQIKHHHFEFESRPNGPGHSNQPYDKHSRAFFYNWCFDKASTKWVCKWDGDMIAMDNAEKYLQQAIEADIALKFKGVDVVVDLYHIGEREFCAPEIRLYKNSSASYDNGPRSESLRYLGTHMQIHEPLFIHTKWAKGEYSQTKAWPKNWKDIPHFQNIYNRRLAKKKHKYTLPLCLR